MTGFIAVCAEDIKVGDVGKLMYEGQRVAHWELFTAIDIRKGPDPDYPVEVVWRSLEDENFEATCEYRSRDTEWIRDRSESCSHPTMRWLDCSDCHEQEQFCCELVCADCGKSC